LITVQGNGFFKLSSPEDLWAKARNDYASFHSSKNEYDLFNLILDLTHLADWLSPGRRSYGNKYDLPISAGPRADMGFVATLAESTQFNTLRLLCNNGKHWKEGQNTPRRGIQHGAVVGLCRAGDRLGDDYYLSDNKDIRAVIDAVMKAYTDHFSNRSPQSSP
jgi:hypothetical protein